MKVHINPHQFPNSEDIIIVFLVVNIGYYYIWPHTVCGYSDYKYVFLYLLHLQSHADTLGIHSFPFP